MPDVSGPWAKQPERQAFFVGDAVLVTMYDITTRKPRRIDVPCRVEKVHEPSPFTSVTGPRVHPWRYTVRPTDEPNPHALLVTQRELRPATLNP